MNKMFRFITVLWIFSCWTTANAGSIVASFTNLSGGLTINGFRLGFPSDDGDNDPSTINFLFDYYDGGAASVFQPITRGSFYNVAFSGATSLGLFNADFNLISPINFNRTGTAPIDALLGSLLPTTFSVSGTPLGELTVRGNTLDLLSITAGPSNEGYFLKLATQITSGAALNALLSTLDRNLNGSVSSEFSGVGADVSAVPEPTMLLLLGSGLCVFGYSRKKS